ncbi:MULTISPECIES: GGDEF domain-containing protein [Arhodomonas]|uniref:GGDEF domain-containing protein n=1 Tax=Arhodomonas TaxID=2368 RepID=UPI000366A547|nr:MULTISPECIES: GGDEF domain-containing protein [Arhodomonas]
MAQDEQAERGRPITRTIPGNIPRRLALRALALLQRCSPGRQSTACRACPYRRRLRESEAKIAELRRRLAEERNRGATDALTGIYNRKAFQERFAVELARRQRYGRRLSLIILDIDHFKGVNDAYGHVTGDRILTAVASRLQAEVRAIDLLARYGGEEFVVLLPETDLQQARHTAGKLLARIRDEHFQTGEHKIGITISAGVTEVRSDDTAARALERSDAGLYAAKNGGRNRIGVSGD